LLLQELLQTPEISPNILFWNSLEEQTGEHLIQEVIGLANAAVDGPRYIFFGVNTGSREGEGIVGISENTIASLKKARRIILRHVKPVLELAFIFDRIEGKLVGVLEIDGCDNAPYVVRKDFSDTLSGGQCWVREGSKLRAVDPLEAEQIRNRGAREHPVLVKIGFYEQPECELLELTVPDTSNPPSSREQTEIKEALDWKEKAHETLGTINTHISRLLHVREHGPDAPFDDRGVDTLNELQSNMEGEEDLADADNYYYFEEQALKLNLVACNTGKHRLRNTSIKLVFPRSRDFDVVDHLYTSPDDTRSQHEIDMADYPEVQQLDDTVIVHTVLGDLERNVPRPLFSSALRLAVKPEVRGKEVSIKYSLKANNKNSDVSGRLKIKFS
jgi:hypothetical protein